jgi:hypothetical protein
MSDPSHFWTNNNGEIHYYKGQHLRISSSIPRALGRLIPYVFSDIKMSFYIGPQEWN